MTQATIAPRVAVVDSDSPPGDSGTLYRHDQRSARSKRRFAVVLLPAVVLIVLAALLRLGIGSVLERLPADYASHVVYDTDGSFRDSLDAAWSSFKQIGRRTDQVLKTVDGVAVMQSSADWSDLSGQVVYQISGTFGVDRQARRNVEGYGDRNRSGQFLFPSHAMPQNYEIWDITYSGKQVATFDRFDEIDGLSVMVFHFEASATDDTASFEYLADVPERFKGFSDGRGTYWVEPVSGLIIDVEDNGRSYFVDPATGKDAGTFSTWHNRYTPETRAALLQSAKRWRMQILAFETWLPATLAALALISLIAGSVWFGRSARRSAVAFATD